MAKPKATAKNWASRASAFTQDQKKKFKPGMCAECKMRGDREHPQIPGATICEACAEGVGS